jgi:hypothetical protein
VKDGVHVVQDRTKALIEATRVLTKQDVLVGVPGETNFKGREAGEPSNADLAYVHDNGAPEANIPARPFMRPGMRAAKKQIVAQLKEAGKASLDGDSTKVTARLHAAGLAAVASIRRVITAGIPPPLAASTVEKRIARRASGTWRRKRRAEVAANVAADAAPGEGIFTPLIDTGALRAAITHVIRARSGAR